MNIKSNNSTINISRKGCFASFFGKFLILLLPIIFSSSIQASTTLIVDVQSGGDDLRSGNVVFIRVNLLDGRSTSEQVLSSGLGGHIAEIGKHITFSENFTSAQIRSVTIRHNGSPRAGHPFDTYDNWNLKYLRIFLNSAVIYEARRDSEFFYRLEHRFTGERREMTFLINRLAGESDFTITNISSSTRTFITVRNLSTQAGRITRVSCREVLSGREMSNSSIVNFTGGQTQTLSLSLPFRGLVACVIFGSDIVTRTNAFEAVI